LPPTSSLFLPSGAPRAPPSSPTRRSSDLLPGQPDLCRPGGGGGPLPDARQRDQRPLQPGGLRAGRPERVLHPVPPVRDVGHALGDRKSTRLNSSHVSISYAVFCLKQKKPT